MDVQPSDNPPAPDLFSTNTVVAFDLETTCVDPKKARIVEIAALKETPSGEVSIFLEVTNPEVDISPDAIAVHGFTNEKVKDAPTFKDYASDLASFLEGCILTGYNITGFDIPVLAAEFKRCGIEFTPPQSHVVDTFSIFKLQEPKTLSKALEFYTGEVLGDAAHGAKADARASLSILKAQTAKYSLLTREDAVNAMRDPSWLDNTGLVAWKGADACITFGKHAGVPLRKVDPGYLRWVVGKDFPPDFKQICTNAMRGVYPHHP